MAVPLPFGALGLSEGVADQLLGLVGHPSGALAMMSFRILMFCCGLTGAIIYLANLREVRGLTTAAQEIEHELIEGDLADEAPAAERVEQRDAAHHRRQHHRQRAERPRQAPAREFDARQHPGQRHAEADRQDRRPRRAPQRQPQRQQHPGGGQFRPHASPRGPPQQPDQGDGQEPDGQGGRDGEQPRHPAPVHVVGGGRNPYSLRTC